MTAGVPLLAGSWQEGVQALIAKIDYHQEREGDALDMRTPAGWVDVRDELLALIKAHPGTVEFGTGTGTGEPLVSASAADMEFEVAISQAGPNPRKPYARHATHTLWCEIVPQ